MYDIEKSIGFLLSKAYQRAWALFKEEFDSFEITPPQFGLLSFLWQQDGLTQVELSEISQIDRTTIGGLIDRLEKAGLVERHPHPQDRRKHLIRLTPKGKEMQAPLSNAAQHVSARFTVGLDEKDITELTRMLTILRGERRVYERPV